MPRATTMHFTEAVAIATSSLWMHKLRSVLTLLGVVIGVTSVIAVVSLINGANQYVATRVFRLGADVFGLSKQPSIITNVDDWLEFQKHKRLTYDDFESVRDLCKSCKEIGASLGGRVEVKSGLNSLKDTNLRAWTPQMPELYDVDLVAGRHITDSDLNSAAPVCVIGMDIVENLLPGLDPLGKEVRWNNIPCEVIGVGKKEGSSLGTSLDNWIILPQFLIVSSTISVIGGALGVFFGVLAAKLVSWVSPLPSAVQLWSVLGGLAVALSVGLFFGTYPASKAAKLDPVEALRSE